MEYLRNKLVSSTERTTNDNSAGKAILIHPGEVEEASHTITIPGKISLEELRFTAHLPDPHDYIENQEDATSDVLDLPHRPMHTLNDTNTIQDTELQQIPNHARETQDAYLDIVIFEFPTHCSPNSDKTCNLPSYGIGAIVDNEDRFGFGIPHPHLSLCNETTGRLIIDEDTFEGYHTTLHIPPQGYIMTDRVTDPLAHRIPSFPSKDTQLEIFFANCDTHAYGTGRNIELAGQILFEYDPSLATEKVIEQGSSSHNYFGGANDSPTHYHIGTNHQQEEYGENFLMDGASKLKLLLVALSVCVFFTLLTCRIRSGTRADYFRERMIQRQRSTNNNDDDNDGSNQSVYSDENSIAEDAEEP